MHCSNIKIKKNLNRSDSKDNYFRWLNKRPVPEARYFPPVKRFLIHPDTLRDINIVQRKGRFLIIYLKSD